MQSRKIRKTNKNGCRCDHLDHHYVNNKQLWRRQPGPEEDLAGVEDSGEAPLGLHLRARLRDPHRPPQGRSRRSLRHPYHDALFFFDIAFPSNYMTHPPEVHYHSFGLRPNPNLFTSGYVCLSLLNTWPGKGEGEVGPIFVDDPPGSGVDPRPGSQQEALLQRSGSREPVWMEASRAYNEKVFILTCKTTLYLLRRAPLNFKAFTAGFLYGKWS
ncbi:hypothetical protein GBA52_007188 [Prunus armeniaca]|nr:hypothetical protein GBA52_007188 [Prunus armeniaca]